MKMNGKTIEEFMSEQFNNMLEGSGLEGEALEEAKAKAKERMDQEMAKSKKQMDTNYMEFKADGTYASFSDGKEETGTWKLSEDGKSLSTSMEGSEKEQTLEIVELSGSKLVVKMSEEGQDLEMTMVPAE